MATARGEIHEGILDETDLFLGRDDSFLLSRCDESGMERVRIQRLLGATLSITEQIDREVERGLVEKGSRPIDRNRRVLREDAKKRFLRDIHGLVARAQLHRQESDELVVILSEEREPFCCNLIRHGG